MACHCDSDVWSEFYRYHYIVRCYMARILPTYIGTISFICNEIRYIHRWIHLDNVMSRYVFDSRNYKLSAIYMYIEEILV